MHVRLIRHLLLCLMILGLVAPRIAAAVALTSSGVQVVVICTGAGLQTVHLDAEGQPLPASKAHPDHCVLVHAADTSAHIALPAALAEPTIMAERFQGDLVRLAHAQAARPPPRGPPAA